MATSAQARRLSIIGLIGLWIPLTALAGGMTPEHVARLQAVAEAMISPDGRHIAYTRTVPRTLFDEPDGAAWSELHVSGPDGASRGFVTGQVNVGSIAWTPDSRHVTFLAKRGDDRTVALYRIAIDGGEAARWYVFDADIRGYSLAPDGRTLAFLAQDPEDEAARQRREQGFSQRVYEEDWRPFKLRLVDLGEDPPRQVRTLPLPGSAQHASFSPAGDRLAVKLAPSELIDDVMMRSRIHFVDPLQGDITAVVETPGKLGGIAWATDGAHLALIMTADASDPREGRLAVVAKDGDKPQDLLPGLKGHVWHIAWRDARHLLFISYEGLTTRLGEIRRDGQAQRTLLAAGAPIWDGISVADNGRVALTGSTAQHPRELYRLDRQLRRPERLTTHNPWLADLRFAPQQRVRYRARDGLEIEALLIRPLDEQPGTRYPLIVQVHGGPEAHYPDGWLTGYSMPGQIAAARGYAVFYPNYRGSTGRGVAFSKLNHGRPAAEEFDDLVDGVDHLIDMGLTDGSRVGITGGSYGGYASAWGATYYSERFAAAVMFVGISDKISMLGTSDIPTELHQVHYLTWPWENWSLYRDASPIYHAQRSHTPTLILHGDADPRVDRSQSMMLYRYLKLVGNAPVRLVLYPGEGHGNSRSASRFDLNLRLMRWMDHYLLGEGGEPPPHVLDYDSGH